MIVTATLASSTDPVALVPGSPDALRVDADTVSARSGALAAGAGAVDKTLIPAWTGEASEAWSTHRQKLADTLGAVDGVHRVAAAVLRNHADVIAWAQGRAEVSVALWAHGQQRSAAWRRTSAGAASLPAPFVQQTGGGSAFLAPVPSPDPGTEMRALAQQILDAARGEVDASETAAVRVLDELGADLPDGEWTLGEFFAGIGEWLSGIGDLLRSFNTVRMFVDPAGYSNDLLGIAHGVGNAYTAATRDPIGTGTVLLDLQGARDSPGRWWGGIAPDLADAVIPGGLVVKGLKLGDHLADLGRAGNRLEDFAHAMPGRWSDLDAVQRWLDEVPTHPAKGPPGEPWFQYQVAHTGPTEFQLGTVSPTGTTIERWADGLTIDPDGIAALDAKFVKNPGDNSMFEGRAGFMQERLMKEFDDQMADYAAIVRDPDNPVSRVRIVASTPESVTYLSERARAVMGGDVDLQVVHRPWEG